MKKLLSILLLSATYFFSINAFGNNIDMLDEKIYISSKDVLIGDNGIFVRLDGQIIHVDNISHDSHGIFIIEPIKLWRCPVCNRDYPGYQDECPFDGTKKPKKWLTNH